jgi:hypothetical protein
LKDNRSGVEGIERTTGKIKIKNTGKDKRDNKQEDVAL